MQTLYAEEPGLATLFFYKWVDAFYMLAVVASLAALPYLLSLPGWPEVSLWPDLVTAGVKVAFVGFLYLPFVTVFKISCSQKLGAGYWVTAILAGAAMIASGFWLGIITGSVISPLVVHTLVWIPMLALVLTSMFFILGPPAAKQ